MPLSLITKIQFIALRDLSGDYKQKLDQWVVKDKLGDILWVSYPLVFQDNLKEVVAEIKKKKTCICLTFGDIFRVRDLADIGRSSLFPMAYSIFSRKNWATVGWVWITVNRMVGMSVVLLRRNVSVGSRPQTTIL